RRKRPRLACRPGASYRKWRSALFLLPLLSSGYGLVFRHARFFSFLQKRHHFAQLAANALNLRVTRRFAHFEKLLAPGLVLADPFARELARLNLAEDALHFGPGFIVHDAR